MGMKLHNIIWVIVIKMEKVLKKMKLKLLNIIKNQLKRNILVQYFNLVIVNLMELELKLIKKMHLSYIKKQQKMGMKLHNIIWVYVIKMEKVLKKMKLKLLNIIKNRLKTNILVQYFNTFSILITYTQIILC